MGAEGAHIVIEELVVLGSDGVKVAVLTFAPAEGNVDIYAERRFVFSGKKSHKKLQIEM